MAPMKGQVYPHGDGLKAGPAVRLTARAAAAGSPEAEAKNRSAVAWRHAEDLGIREKARTAGWDAGFAQGLDAARKETSDALDHVEATAAEKNRVRVAADVQTRLAELEEAVHAMPPDPQPATDAAPPESAPKLS